MNPYVDFRLIVIRELLEMIDRVKHKRSAKAFEQEEKETTKRDFEAEVIELNCVIL